MLGQLIRFLRKLGCDHRVCRILAPMQGMVQRGSRRMMKLPMRIDHTQISLRLLLAHVQPVEQQPPKVTAIVPPRLFDGHVGPPHDTAVRRRNFHAPCAPIAV